MSRIDEIAHTLRASGPQEYVYWTDSLELVAGLSGPEGARLSHLRVAADSRQSGLATDALIALVQVLEEAGVRYLDAEVGATTIPEDGSAPAYTDPTARFLRLASFEDVDPVRPTDSDTEWAFSGRRTLHPSRRDSE